MLGYNRNRDTSRWQEGDKTAPQDIRDSAVRSVGNGLVQFDAYNGNITVNGKVRPAVEKLEMLCDTQAEAFEYLRSQGCAVGVYSEQNVKMY